MAVSFFLDKREFLRYYRLLLLFDSKIFTNQIPRKGDGIMPHHPEWITADYLTKMTRCLPIGDVWLMPQQIIRYEKFTDIINLPYFLRYWAEKIEKLHFLIPAIDKFDSHFRAFKQNKLSLEWDEEDIRVAARNLFRMFLERLGEIYWEYFRLNNDGFSDKRLKTLNEPAWMKKMPKAVRGDLRAKGAVNRFDQPWLVPNLPFTGISYLLNDNGLFAAIDKVLYLRRLMGILQLSNLMDPSRTYSQGFIHTRFVHSMDTYVIMLLILYNNRHILPKKLFKSLAVAALIHDLATPAGGDGTKIIDPDYFCEERNLPEYIKLYSAGWKKVCESLNLIEEIIFQSVRGLGLCGKILDVADKLAYSSRDTSIFLNRFDTGMKLIYSEDYREIQWRSGIQPPLYSAWDSVKIVGQEVVFLNPKKLGDAMHGRALMCKNFYFNAYARSFEAILAKCVLSYLYAKKLINRSLLYQITDRDLEGIVSKFTGVPFAFHASHALGRITTETFASLEAAKKREAEIIKDGNFFVTIEDTRGRIKPATHFLVRTPEGKICPYSEACPEEAGHIQSIVTLEKALFLHYLENTEIQPEAAEKLRIFQKEELGRREFEQK
ncbi:MAG: hypothetical protein WC831_03715 [Parcubacteria group bacterium]